MGRRVLFSFAFVLGLFAVGFGIVYVLSEIKLRQFVRAPAFDQPIPEDAASLKRGEHIARTRGCFGCHGQQLEGAEFSEGFGWGHRAVAPNLAKYAKEHNIATLETAIRGGVGTDGRALWFMPSYNYKHLDNHDLAALIAFLRSATVVESDLAAPRLGFMTRWSLVTGSEDHMAALVLTVPPLRLDSKAGSRLAQGEYIAMTTCNDTHYRLSWV